MRAGITVGFVIVAVIYMVAIARLDWVTSSEVAIRLARPLAIVDSDVSAEPSPPIMHVIVSPSGSDTDTVSSNDSDDHGQDIYHTHGDVALVPIRT